MNTLSVRTRVPTSSRKCRKVFIYDNVLEVRVECLLDSWWLSPIIQHKAVEIYETWEGWAIKYLLKTGQLGFVYTSSQTFKDHIGSSVNINLRGVCRQ